MSAFLRFLRLSVSRSEPRRSVRAEIGSKVRVVHFCQDCTTFLGILCLRYVVDDVAEVVVVMLST